MKRFALREERGEDEEIMEHLKAGRVGEGDFALLCFIDMTY